MRAFLHPPNSTRIRPLEAAGLAIGPEDSPFAQRRVDFDGRPIGPLRLGRAMLVTTLAGSSVFMALGILWPNAQASIIFLEEQLGASKKLLGINLALCTLATLASLPGAWLYSRMQSRRKQWIWVTAASRAFMFAPALVALFTGKRELHTLLIWVFIIGLFLVNLGNNFTSSGWWSWMADLIPESIRGTFFGRRWRWVLLTQSITALIAGLLLDQAAKISAGEGDTIVNMAYFAVFAFAALLAVLDPFLFFLVPEPSRPRPPECSFREVMGRYLEPIRDRDFLPLLLGVCVYNFFFGMPLVFITVFLRGDHAGGVHVGGHASLGLLSLVTVTVAVASALTANRWGQLADRIGHRVVWILTSMSYLSYAAYFFVNEQNYAYIAVIHAALWGLMFAGQPMAAQNLALSMAPTDRREFYMSMFNGVASIGGAIGPVVGGILADKYRLLPWMTLPSGQPACYIHLLLIIAFIGILLTLPLMARVPDPRGATLLPWFGRLVNGELARMAWNLGILSTTPHAGRQLRALRRLGTAEGNVLLPEIMAALEDSDLSIRREALLALGRLGTPEALELLRWFLHEPDALMRAPSVEAIAHTRIPDRISLLKRALRDPDQRVRRAAAEALGRSGDASAGDDLRDLLAGERDGEVLVSAAVALSRLKEFGALREMLQQALHAENSTVRAQMLVALADLLSGTADFHTLWRQDRRWRGKGFAYLAKRIRKQARALSRTPRQPGLLSRGQRRQILRDLDDEIERLLEHAQEESWPASLTSLRVLANQLLRLRYGYEGSEEDALEFLSAVSPDQAQRYWLLTYLQHTAGQGNASAAPWDGLTLLALHVLVHGQPAG